MALYASSRLLLSAACRQTGAGAAAAMNWFTTLAKVLRVERDFVTVDGGCLKQPVRLAKAELREGQLVSSSLPKSTTATAGGGGGADPSKSFLPLLRSGPSDVRVGDVLRFHVAHLTSPYGDASLSAEPRPRPAAARAAAWNAVLAAAGAERTRAAAAAAGGRTSSPPSSEGSSSSSSSSSSPPPAPPPFSTGKVVYGRVLNALPSGGGYAVGVAGVVGFLPFSAAAPSTGARVGVLQRFRVTSAVPSTGSFVLEDEGAAARRVAQARRHAVWAAARREAAGAAGGEEEGGGDRFAAPKKREPREPRRQQQQQRRGGSASSASASAAQQQQRGQQQRGSRQPRQQRGGAASEREDGWYQPSSRR